MNRMYFKIVDLSRGKIQVNIIKDRITSLTSLIFCSNKRVRVNILPVGVNVVLVNNRLYLFSSNLNRLNIIHVNVINNLCSLYLSYTLILQINGIGYKFVIKNSYLYLFLGFSHLIKIRIPKYLKFRKSERNLQIVCGDKYIIGNIYNILKNLKKKDNYGGKGIKRIYDKLVLKVGKINSIRK